MAERAKSLILKEFPYTSYAEFVRNPKSNTFSASSDEVEKTYQDAFNLYTEGKYTESSERIDQALTAFPKDALVPKFELLKAFNTGKTAGKEIMILQLEQIALNYPKTHEGQKAAEMLRYLKSDLKVEMTDDTGNKVENRKTEPNAQGFEQEQPGMPQDPKPDQHSKFEDGSETIRRIKPDPRRPGKLTPDQ